MRHSCYGDTSRRQNIDKQIFIALDEADKYNDIAKDIIKANTCLRLDHDSEALFGMEWGKKKNAW